MNVFGAITGYSLRKFKQKTAQTFIYDQEHKYSQAKAHPQVKLVFTSECAFCFQISALATLKMVTSSMVAFCHIGNLTESVASVVDVTGDDVWSYHPLE